MEDHDNESTNHSRRHFMAGFAAMFCAEFASSVFSPTAAAHALAFDGQLPYQAKLLNRSQMALLANIVDLVIPATDTPGALAVNCHQFIDSQLFHCHDQTKQRSMVDLLDFIELSAINQLNKQGLAKKPFLQPFSMLNQSQQIQLLNDIEQAKAGFDQGRRKQFKQLKALICFGYYTSQVGASQELKYQAIPAGYKASLSYKMVGRSWGSIAYY